MSLGRVDIVVHLIVYDGKKCIKWHVHYLSGIPELQSCACKIRLLQFLDHEHHTSDIKHIGKSLCIKAVQY